MCCGAWTLALALLPSAIQAGTNDALTGVGGAERRHPQDGPDVDLRIDISAEGVRMQLRMNLAFVDEVVPQTRENEDELHAVERDGLRDALLAQVVRDHGVWIDGEQVQPTLRGFDDEPPNPDLLPLFPNAGARALWQVRLDLSYASAAAPEEVRLRWGSYPPDSAIAPRDEAPPVSVIGYLRRSGGPEERLVFTVDEPEHTWSAASAPPAGARFLPVPGPTRGALHAGRDGLIGTAVLFAVSLFLALATVLAGRRTRVVVFALLALTLTFAVRGLMGQWRALPELNWPPPEEEVLAAFEPLHANIYRAFDFTAEQEIYAALERSVEGALLDELYVEIYSGLVLQEEGGLIARVERVEPLTTEVVEVTGGEGVPRRATVEHAWRVHAALRHWGHSHLRKNRYRARYDLVPTEAGWRIAATLPLEQEREELTPGEGSEF